MHIPDNNAHPRQSTSPGHLFLNAFSETGNLSQTQAATVHNVCQMARKLSASGAGGAGRAFHAD